jgi:Flp pilus assembly protein TadD/spermidine synthase
MKTKNLVAYATVFLSGACIMIVELAAGRLISRHLGQSLYTWTSVIGVILAGISAGNFLGGRLADARGEAVRKIAAVFVCASLCCVLIPVLNNRVAEWPALWRLTWPTRIFLHVLLAFFAPSILLGMISPVVAKWVLADSDRLGSSVGNLYAWNTAGSIAGTFLAGFYLIAWIGASQIVLVVAVLLAAAGLGFAARAFWTRAWAAAALLALALGTGPGVTLASWGETVGLRARESADTVYRDESEYSYIRVTAESQDPTQRTMLLDKLKHSDFDTANPLNLCYDYTWIYEGVVNTAIPSNRPVAALILGGGAYAFPRWLEAARPRSRVDVCEIDPAVTKAAYVACGLASNTTIRSYNVDARVLVAQFSAAPAKAERPRYDFIFGDSVSDYSVPYQLTTVEFTRMVASLLADDGVYALNLIDCYYPGNFLGSMIRTCRDVFPNVEVFSCNPSLEERDTFVLVCSKTKREWAGLADRIRAARPYGGRQFDDATIAALLRNPVARVLTDDHAPVENLLAPIVRKDKEGMIDWHFDRGVTAAQKGDFEGAARHFRAVLDLYPRSEYAYNYLGRSLEQLNDPHGALDAYAAALQFKPRFVEPRNNAAMLLARMGQMDAAIQQWREVLAINPNLIESHNNLGTALAQKGDVQGALGHWNQTLKLSPDDPVALANVGGAFAARGEVATAALYFEKALGRSQTPELIHQQLARLYEALGDRVRAGEHAAKAGGEHAK